jgi:class 3 adenylate cyclase
VVEHLGRPAIAALWKWSQRLALAFTESFERAGKYAVGGEVLPHYRFWAELVATGELSETAVLFVDALRLDLAEALVRKLEAPGRQLTTRLGLASLPSKTPVGMASLLPAGGAPFAVRAHNSKLRSEIGDRDVSDPGGRIEQLRRVVGEIVAGELGQVSEAQLSAWAKARRPVVLMTRDIDESGEIAANVAPDLFEDLIAELARTVTVLHRAGYRRVVLGTDHGFLLVPAGAALDKLPNHPGKGSEMTVSTRYAVGELAPEPGCLALTPQQMGRAGTASALLPRGLQAFPIPGKPHRFIHGGLSPQECVLRFVTSTVAGPPRAPVQVHLAHVPPITSLILYLSVEVATPTGPAQPRRARAEARSGDKVIGRSEAVVYKPSTEMSAGETYPRIKLVLKEPSPTIDVVLLDEDSGDELDRQEAVPNVMRREEEDLL